MWLANTMERSKADFKRTQVGRRDETNLQEFLKQAFVRGSRSCCSSTRSRWVHRCAILHVCARTALRLGDNHLTHLESNCLHFLLARHSFSELDAHALSLRDNLIVLGELFHRGFLRQVQLQHRLDHGTDVQLLGVLGEGTKVENVVSHRLWKGVHSVDKVSEWVLDPRANVLVRHVVMVIKHQACLGACYWAATAQAVWVARRDNAHRVGNGCAVHGAVANEFIEEPHAVARVDFVEKHNVHEWLAPRIERRRRRYLGKDVLWQRWGW
jgi:hypothetical protein